MTMTETITARLPHRPLTALALALGLGVATLAAPALAQETAPPPVAGDFTDSQLEAFAMAALKVAEIRDNYQLALAEAGSEAEQQELIVEGNDAMLAAVDETPGITVEEYIVIGETAAADPELGERLATLIETMMVQ